MAVVQGQKSLFSRAYDYAISDVPIAEDAYRKLDRCAACILRRALQTHSLSRMHGLTCVFQPHRPILQVPFAISAMGAVHSIAGECACPQAAPTACIAIPHGVVCLYFTAVTIILEQKRIIELSPDAGLNKRLMLNPFLLGSILQCTITRWDDPAIRAINPDARSCQMH